MEFMQFLQENFYIVAIALWILGEFIKPIKKIPNNSIPFILLVCSWGLGIIVLGFSPTVIIQGIVATGVAVLADNIRKIVTPKKEGD